jgi:hypothetical protein
MENELMRSSGDSFKKNKDTFKEVADKENQIYELKEKLVRKEGEVNQF